MNNWYFQRHKCHSIVLLGQKSGVTDYEDFILGNLNESAGHK